MKSIGDSVDLHVVRQESNFDRACDAAYLRAINHFEIDEDGHSRRIKDWDRTCCCIELEFIRYKRIGNEHCYLFRAAAVKSEC
jgi:hypothetical protein